MPSLSDMKVILLNMSCEGNMAGFVEKSIRYIACNTYKRDLQKRLYPATRLNMESTDSSGIPQSVAALSPATPPPSPPTPDIKDML